MSNNIDWRDSVVVSKLEMALVRARISALEAENARLRDAVIKARDTFSNYGDLHAAKPDTVKAQRNYDLRDEMATALSTTEAGG